MGSANLRFECSLSGIKIHFREFLYDFALKRNKLPGPTPGYRCSVNTLLTGSRALRDGGRSGSGAPKSPALCGLPQKMCPTSSKALDANLEATGFLRPIQSAAHHIVAGAAPAAAQARAVLQKFGIDINEAANGVFLSASQFSANPTGAAVHASLHSGAYYETVNRILETATSSSEV